MRRAILLLFACGTPPREPARTALANVVAAPATAPLDSYCPSIRLISVWAYELFPACQPPPLSMELITLCGGKPCPLPCARMKPGDRGTPELLFHYDKHDRYLGTTRPEEELEDACTYDAAGHIVSCGKEKSERDESGRLVGIGDLAYMRPITYDAQGRISTFEDVQFEYDTAGRLARFADIVLERDGDRVVRRRFSFGDTPGVVTVGYDAAGRTTSEIMRFAGDAMTGIDYLVEYDRDRVRSTSVGKPSSPRVIEYGYDCR